MKRTLIFSSPLQKGMNQINWKFHQSLNDNFIQMKSYLIPFIVAACFITSSAFSQEVETEAAEPREPVVNTGGVEAASGEAEAQNLGFNPNSLNPIHESNIMYQKRVWRRMDLKEKQNRPFFAFNNEITRIIINAVKNGTLQPYMNDSLKTRMSKEIFVENLQLPDYGATELTEEEKAMGFKEDENSGWGDDWGAADGAAKKEEKKKSTVEEFLPGEISILELMEDMIFDKQRSRLYWDIIAVKLVIPAERFETGLIREVATFKYKDLAELFMSMPKEAIWFNPQNSAEHKNLADAFQLRLFSARIIKVANPGDKLIEDIYNRTPKDGLIASQRIEQELMETEHNMWEF